MLSASDRSTKRRTSATREETSFFPGDRKHSNKTNRGIWNEHVCLKCKLLVGIHDGQAPFYSYSATVESALECTDFEKCFHNWSVTLKLQYKLGAELVRVKTEPINIQLIDPFVLRLRESLQVNLSALNCYWCDRIGEMFPRVNGSERDLFFFLLLSKQGRSSCQLPAVSRQKRR